MNRSDEPTDVQDIPENLGNRLEDEPQENSKFKAEPTHSFLQRIMIHKDKMKIELPHQKRAKEGPPRPRPAAPEFPTQPLGMKGGTKAAKKSADSGCLPDMDRRDPGAEDQIDHIRKTVKRRVDAVKQKYGKKNAELNNRLSDQIRINREQEARIYLFRSWFKANGIADPTEDCS
ncbi:MAG: hypothetical protein KAJ73_00160 [Zetaproteobacteria bacterium]|nr:hypothetical protein [Zetaproteobacteria bacterium]